ncbi:C40 family peptidase [Galbitalea soli]|uniref:C40 family peptidase n=1 Tax=Galbitalea soli TaxID=1268042 RepID=A0A7C9PP21_9MICO|nr:C40 family peptidase [Galbitalea soli]NEM91987.1 C40 family peptidase [Galbitalea soli]NYJ32063.1 cell wall-associated NlpC family hydrolase [Galbitalea soli]
MTPGKRPLGLLALIVVGTIAVSVGLTGPALAAPTFPSWADVQRAKHNVKAKQAEIKTLTALIGTLQQQSDAAGKTALQLGEAYLVALNAYNAASQKADTLKAQADAASAKSKASSQVAGQLAAYLARNSGGDLTLSLLFGGGDPRDLLGTLGTANKLTEQTAAIYEQAAVDANAAKALTAQARVAEDARATKSRAAAAALATAKAAAQAAQAKVAYQNKQQATMTAQLALLKGTSAKVQAAYYAGVAWERKQEEQKTPPPDPPSNNGGGGAGSGDGGSGGGSSNPPGPPDVSAVGGAIAFAEAQLGEPYVLGGMGPNVWDCSGLTKAAYASVGVYIGTHSATDQYNTMKSEGRLIPLSQRQAGDLLWYSDGGTTWGSKYHVTLYIGNGEMIEAPYPGATVRIRAVRYGDLVPYAGRPTG